MLGLTLCSICFPACVGAPAYGDLDIAGIGPALDAASAPDVKKLRESCLASNIALLRSLKQVDAETGEIMLHHVRAEAKEGRMSEPVPVTEMDLSSVLLHPRFVVVQTRIDGSKKLRMIDNFSWSALLDEERRSKKKRKAGSINGHTALHEKISHDHIDDLFETVKLHLDFNKVLSCTWARLALCTLYLHFDCSACLDFSKLMWMQRSDASR